jgi:hypothetical protein
MNQPDRTEVDILPSESFSLVHSIEMSMDACIGASVLLLKGGTERTEGFLILFEVVLTVHVHNKSVYSGSGSVISYNMLSEL